MLIDLQLLDGTSYNNTTQTLSTIQTLVNGLKSAITIKKGKERKTVNH